MFNGGSWRVQGAPARNVDLELLLRFALALVVGIVMAGIFNCRRLTLISLIVILLITSAAATDSTFLIWVRNVAASPPGWWCHTVSVRLPPPHHACGAGGVALAVFIMNDIRGVVSSLLHPAVTLPSVARTLFVYTVADAHFALPYPSQITLTLPLVALLIIDYMFGDTNQFDFDTDYKNWVRKQRAA